MAKKLYTTGIGTAVYPRIETADTKYVAEGVYKLKLEMDEATAAKTLALLEQGMADAQATAKKENPGKRIKVADAPFTVDADTGLVSINFKLKASGKTKEGKEFTQKVAVFDAKGEPFLDSRIGGGTKLRVSFEMSEFYTAIIGAGITLRLRAVQVIDYQPYGARDAAGFGFEETDGFESSTPASVEKVVTEDVVAEAGEGAEDSSDF